jgi:hypothetical protein
MPNILDELFESGLTLPDGNELTVQFAMTTNEMTKNLVSYTRWTLLYYRANPLGLQPASFRGFGMAQFFSDRLWPSPEGNNPFDPNRTDRLDVTITWGLVPDRRWVAIFPSEGPPSPGGHPSLIYKTVPLTVDSSTGVIYGVIDGQTFITISLCNPQISKSPSN